MNEIRRNEEFQTTHWSLIVSSRENDSSVRRCSLEALCEAYWYPLFAYLRRKGHAPEQTADYVQGFFAELIDKGALEDVSPEKGHFRWFLMSSIKRFVASQIEKQTTQKRGGGRKFISLNVDDAEQRYRLEPVDGWSAEKLFDRRWALEVLQLSLDRLQAAHEEKGKLELYLALRPTLTGEQMKLEQYTEIGQRLGLHAGAVKVSAFRLRQKYRETIRRVISETVVELDDVEDELDKLLSALRG